MSRIKRVWWIVLVLAGPFFLPADGYCFDVDPYYYNILNGRVFFEYQKIDNKYFFQPADQRKSFLQTYDLTLSGRLLSSRIATFNSHLNFSRDDQESTINGNSTVRRLDYGLRTTLLPRSAIPLTLYGDRTENKTAQTGAVQNVDTTTNYGLYWLGRFRTLPVTSVTVDKSDTTALNSKTEQTQYTVDATKEVASTSNHVVYRGNIRDDRIRDTSSTSDSISYTNITKISRDTVMNLGLTKSRSYDPGSAGSSAEAYSMNLNSKPSQEFNQSHSYTTFSAKSQDTRSEGTTYDGKLDYAFSSRLTSTYSLDIFNTSNTSATSAARDETLKSAAALKYSLSKHWSAGENIGYSKISTYNQSNTSTNLSSRETLSEYTNLGYARPGEWVSGGGAYGVGYVEDHLSDGRGGSGMSETMSAGLSKGKHEVDYVGLNSSLVYSRTSALVPVQNTNNAATRVWDEKTSLKLEASNKIWKQYLYLIGSYDKADTKSWLVISNSKTDYYKLDVVSTYFKNTKIKAYASRQMQFNTISGSSTTNERAWDIEHGRRLLGGGLGLAYNYTFSDSFYPGGNRKDEKTNYRASYTRGFPGNTVWQATLLWSKTLSDNVTIVTDSITNTIGTPLMSSILVLSHKYEISKSPNSTTTTNEGKMSYMLRAWLISVEDTYSVIEQAVPVAGNNTTNTFIARISRGFVTIL